MNLEERQKEKDLRQEAKEKNLRRTEIEKKTFLLAGVRHEAEEVVYSREGRGSRGTTKAVAGGMSDGKSDKLKVAYTNVDGLLSSMLEI